MTRKLALVALLSILLLLPLTVSADSAGADRVSGVAAIQSGAAGAALGSTATVNIADLSSVFLNPALAASLRSARVSFDIIPVLKDIVYYDVSLIYPFTRSAFAFRASRFSYGSFYQIQDNTQVGDDLTPSDELFSLVWAGYTEEDMFVGLGLSYVSKYAENFKDLYLDMGLMRRFELSRYFNSISLGLTIRDISLLYQVTGPFQVPTIRAGLALEKKPFGRFMTDVKWEYPKTLISYTGLELFSDYYISPRFGYRSGPAGLAGFSAGIGAKFSHKSYAAMLDYALTLNQMTGLRHEVTITLSMKQKSRFRTTDYEYIPMTKKEKTNIAMHIRTGMSAISNKKYDAAIREFKVADSIRPGQPEINSLIRKAMIDKASEEARFNAMCELTLQALSDGDTNLALSNMETLRARYHKRAEFEELLSKLSDTRKAYQYLAVAESNMVAGQYRKASAAFSNTLRIIPGRQDIFDCFEEVRNKAEALDLVEQARQLVKQQQSFQATWFLKKALTLDPECRPAIELFDEIKNPATQPPVQPVEKIKPKGGKK